jgi:hypothetical protein
MTNEEAIFCIKGIKNIGHDIFTEQKDFQKCLDMALKALEQEPCDDCVSRQAVLDFMQIKMGGKELYKSVYEMPPVRPMSKRSKWIKQNTAFVNDDNQIITECHCANCYGISYFRSISGELVGAKYCPACGAEMDFEE